MPADEKTQQLWNRRRISRALSWMKEAEKVSSPHARFVFLWIAFNALYGQAKDILGPGGKSSICPFFKKIIRNDSNKAVFLILRRRKAVVEKLLLLLPAYSGYWKAMYSKQSHEKWEGTFSRFQSNYIRACRMMSMFSPSNEDVLFLLNTIFDRLYVIRNQQIHGASTKGDSPYVSHVNAGIVLLGELVPQFTIIMSGTKNEDWKEIPYPRIGAPDTPGPPPKLFKE